jgi:hypothetical protein
VWVFLYFFGLSLPGDPGHDKSKFFWLQRQPQTSHISQLEAEIRLLCFIVCFCAKVSKFVWAVVTNIRKMNSDDFIANKTKALKTSSVFCDRDRNNCWSNKKETGVDGMEEEYKTQFAMYYHCELCFKFW